MVVEGLVRGGALVPPSVLQAEHQCDRRALSQRGEVHSPL